MSGKTLANLTKSRKRKTQIKFRNKKGNIKHIAIKFRRSYENILKIYTAANWKIEKK
jgi:hypothetical protein